MLENIIAIIERVVVDYGFLGIFLAAFFEEIISIVPSVAVIMFAGFFVMMGLPIEATSFFKLLFQVSLPVALGLTLGSLFIYGIVYWLGKPAIEKFGSFFGISWEEIEKVQARLKGGRMDDLILVLVRALPIVPFSVSSAFCGLVRWRLRDYLLLTFLGGFLRASIVGFLGWQLGSLYKGNALIFESLEKQVGIFLALALIGYLIYRYFKRQKSQQV